MLTAQEISREVTRAVEDGKAIAIISLFEAAGETSREMPRLLVREDGGIAGTLGSLPLDQAAARHAARVLADDRQEIVAVRAVDIDELAGDARIAALQLRLLFEVSRPALELIVCGAGHVGEAVARAGTLFDLRVTVIDDRLEFASRERFPNPQIRLIAADFVEALQSLRITAASHVIIVTRGHRHDEICLREVIESPARYIGMIGSRRRTTTIREHLRRSGVPADRLRRIHAPIGLDVGAQTPEEIAVAILAEIILVRRGGTGQPKSAQGPMARAR
jgi:xanthine dehydrogenase accessory factor